MKNPLHNPQAGPVRPGQPPARYPTRAEAIHALRAGVHAALMRLAREPGVRLAHLANTAALVTLDARPQSSRQGQVRQAEMVTLANWIGDQIREATAESLPALLDDFEALCKAAPMPEE